MSSMESLDRLQAELSGNVYADAFHTLYKLSQDVSVEHSELMAQDMKWVHKEKVEPLEAENAKLRELLQDYHRYEHEDCYSCRYINECRADESGRCIAPMRLGERYRELGIEVDDGQQRDV